MFTCKYHSFVELHKAACMRSVTKSEWEQEYATLDLFTREVPHFADYGYGYVLVIHKVYLLFQSSALPDFPDYGYGAHDT